MVYRVCHHPYRACNHLYMECCPQCRSVILVTECHPLSRSVIPLRGRTVIYTRHAATLTGLAVLSIGLSSTSQSVIHYTGVSCFKEDVQSSIQGMWSPIQGVPSSVQACHPLHRVSSSIMERHALKRTCSHLYRACSHLYRACHPQKGVLSS